MIDQTKKYRTRDGKEVRVYATDGAVPYSVHGATLNDGEWVVFTWTAGGEYAAGSSNKRDIIEVREKLTVSGWVNLYRLPRGISMGHVYHTKEEACLARAGIDTTACVHVTVEYEEGGGL